MKWLWILLGLVVVFFVFGWGASLSPEGKARSMDRQAIALCWEDYNRKSLAPETQRFIASTCEMMERKYVQKHGSQP